MLLKIPLKKKSSNKTETLPEKSNINDIPKPFIDKISIIVDLPPRARHHVHQEFFSNINDKDVYKDAPKAMFKDFKIAKRIALPSLSVKLTDDAKANKSIVKKYPLIQLAYDKKAKQAHKLRLEFVPVDLGKQGMQELANEISGLMHDGWDYLLQHGRVTRLDITVDFPNLTTEDIHFLPQQMLTYTTWKSNGKLETITCGKRKGNQTLIYDRGAKRTAFKQSSEGKNGVRIERRLVKKMSTLLVSELTNFSNPFSAMSFVSDLGILPPPKLPSSSEWIWPMFCDSVKQRSLQGALALLSEERRTQFRTHLKLYSADWWKPDLMWAHWKEMLKEMHLSK